MEPSTADLSPQILSDLHVAERGRSLLGVAGFPWSGRDVDTIMHGAELSAAANKRSKRQPALVQGNGQTDPGP